MALWQKVLVGLAGLVLLAAAGAGGWWFAAEKGLVAGRPNSPRPENFKRALDEHLARTTQLHNRPCASVDTSRPPDGTGPKDIRFDWTPASFRMVFDPRRPSPANSPRRYAYLAKQGFFDEKALPEGGTEYALTWKGMAAATGQGCFRMAGSERSAEVISFSLKRNENGVDVYEVIARPLLERVEPWARDPAFREAFPDAQYKGFLEPQPVAYELARTERGFDVVAEQGRSLTGQPQYAMRATAVAKLAGGVTRERARAALESYLGGPQGAYAARICLMPPQPNEADENTLDMLRVPAAGAEPAPVTYTVYNLLSRQRSYAMDPLRGYLVLKKFESLGFATSEAIPAAEFRGQPAAGAVRFTLAKPFVERAARDRCYLVATAQVDDIVRIDPLTDFNLTPQFLARVKAKPVDAEAAKVMEAFPHFARLQEVGGVMRGTLQYQDQDLRVVSANPQWPTYFPDPAEAKLPTIESPPGTPSRPAIGPPFGKPAAAGPLYQASSAKLGDGRMDIVVRELERRARASVVQVDIRRPGSSVGASLFIACSLRALARERGGFRNVAKLENTPRPGQMTVAFLRSPAEPAAAVDPAFAPPARPAELVNLEQFAPVCDQLK